MFSRKQQQDSENVRKSIHKLLDPRKDLFTRLKHLRNVIDNANQIAESQVLIELYHSHIYYVFYENFLAIEQQFHANPRQIANSRAAREELDCMLWILEEIISYLPDLIHQKWQYNSISDVMKRLLHPDNSIKMRKEAIALFLLWLQALQENAGITMKMLFACLVPGFPPAVDKATGNRYTIDSIMKHNGPISEDGQDPNHDIGVACLEINPLIQMGDSERPKEDPTKFYIEIILEFMVTQAKALSWKDHVRGPGGFTFLWDMFKEFYLPHMFKNIENLAFDFDLYGVTDGKLGGMDLCEMLTSKVHRSDRQKSSTHSTDTEKESQTGSASAHSNSDAGVKTPKNERKSSSFSKKSLESESSSHLISTNLLSAKVSTLKWLICFVSIKDSEINNIYHGSMVRNQQKLAKMSQNQQRRITDERYETDSGYSLPVGGDAGTLHRQMQQLVIENGENTQNRASFPHISDKVSEPSNTPSQVGLNATDTSQGGTNSNSNRPSLTEQQAKPTANLTSNHDEIENSSRHSHDQIDKSDNDIIAPSPAPSDSGHMPIVLPHYDAGHMALSSYMISHYPEVLNVSPDDLVRATLFGSRTNVNVIMELIRQGFMLPLSEIATIRKIINVFMLWIESEENTDPPIFAQDPMLDRLDGKPHEYSIRAGHQILLLSFISASARVFLLYPKDRDNNPKIIDNQVEVCKRVLNVYRYMVLNITMDDGTWNQLLLVLLYITRSVIGVELEATRNPSKDSSAEAPPQDPNLVPADPHVEPSPYASKVKPTSHLAKSPELGNRLAASIFQTLIVSWIKANLYVSVSPVIWDDLMDTLTALTEWPELITEWQKTMDTLTRLLGKQVYQLDMSDLPLSRLNDKPSRSRGRAKLDSRTTTVNSYHQSSDHVTHRTAPTEASHEHTSSGGGNHSGGRNTSKDSEFSKNQGNTGMRGAYGNLSASSTLATSTQQLQASVKKHRLSNRRSSKASNQSIPEKDEDAKSDDTIQDDEEHEENENQSSSNRSGSMNRNVSNMTGSECSHASSSHGGIRRNSKGQKSTSEEASGNKIQRFAVSHQSVQLKSMHDAHGGLFSSHTESAEHVKSEEGLQGDDDRPVISGGKRIGWTPENAAAMWHRLLGMLGNINNVQDSEVYRRIFVHLLKMFKDLEKIRDNRGVCYDNCFTPEPPELMPPLQVFIPWCFQALVHKSSIDVSNYKSGLIVACELLARSFSCRQDLPMNEEQILLFYYIFQNELDKALEDQDHRLDIVAELINYLSPAGATLAENVHGISLFLPSLLSCCKKMVMNDHPKSEKAIELLGSLGTIAWSVFESHDFGANRTITEYQGMVKSINNAGQVTIKLEPKPDFHKEVLSTLFSICKNDTIKSTFRSKAVSAATCWVLAELNQNSIESETIELFFGIVVGLLRHDSYILALNACTSLSLLRIHIKKIESYFKPESNFSAHILNLLTRILGYNINKLLTAHQNNQVLQKDLPTACTRFFTTLITQILEWILTVPATTLFAFSEHTIPDDSTTSKGIGPKAGVTELTHIIASTLSLLAKPVLTGKIPKCTLQDLSEAAECGFDTDLAFDILITEDELVGRGVSGAMSTGNLSVLSHQSGSGAPRTPKLVARKESIRLYSDDKDQDGFTFRSDAATSHYGSTLDMGALSTSMMSLNTTYTGAGGHLRQDLSTLVEQSEMADLGSNFDLATIEASGNRPEYSSNTALDDFDKESVVTQLSVKSTNENTESTSGKTKGKLMHKIELNSTIHQASKAVFARFAALVGQWPLGSSPSIFGSSFMNEMSDQFVQYGQNGQMGGPNMGGSTMGGSTMGGGFGGSTAGFGLGSMANMSVASMAIPKRSAKAPDLSRDLFDSPSTTFLCYNDCIVSVIELEKSATQDKVPNNFDYPNKTTRFIIRNAMGKFVWDSVELKAPEFLQKVQVIPAKNNKQMGVKQHLAAQTSDIKIGQKIRSNDDGHNEVKEKKPDKLSSLLSFVTKSSPEVVSSNRKANNLPLDTPSITLPNALESQTEHDITETLMTQTSKTNEVKNQADAYLSSRIPRASKKYSLPCPVYDQVKDEQIDPERLEQLRIDNETELERACTAWGISCSFLASRSVCDMLDMLSFKSRKQVFTLNKTERLLRELKNLDKRDSRETHKVAVIYIARGQEDKISILSQKQASLDFEQFLGSLGWEVPLDNHPGFKGGISYGSCGKSAPYYSTASYEVMFHVTTRFPTYDPNDVNTVTTNILNENEEIRVTEGNIKESRTMKLRHVGNDEIHIVWSEHWREYRKGTIPTEFGDVVIVIYPTKYEGLYRIQIIKKKEIPDFGPLYDGALVERSVLGELVRETAIQAGRARRACLTGYKQYFEERAHYLDQLIKNYRENNTFEQFAAELFTPVQKGVLDSYQHRGKHSMLGKYFFVCGPRDSPFFLLFFFCPKATLCS